MALRTDIRHARARLAPCAERLAPAFARLLQQRLTRLDNLDKLLESYSYRSVLDRGFALVTDAHGTVVRSTGQATPGKMLAIEVADGTVGATVSGAPAIPRRRRRVIDPDERQKSLF
jgi:exodeoxyribonuclease VII large subunit